MLTGHGPRERHWRMARNQEFDVCEFNVGGYLMSRDHGDPLAAIPVFLHRRFRHGFAFVNVNSGIKTPKDLIGKRVGGTNFQPAGNIWLRGIFEEHFGVLHKGDYLARRPQRGCGVHAAAGLKIEMIPAGKSMDSDARRGRDPRDDQSVHSGTHRSMATSGSRACFRITKPLSATISDKPVSFRLCM